MGPVVTKGPRRVNKSPLEATGGYEFSFVQHKTIENRKSFLGHNLNPYIEYKSSDFVERFGVF